MMNLPHGYYVDHGPARARYSDYGQPVQAAHHFYSNN